MHIRTQPLQGRTGSPGCLLALARWAGRSGVRVGRHVTVEQCWICQILLGGRDAESVEGLRDYRLGGLGERRKLPQWGPGQRPGRKRIWWTIELPESHWWQSFFIIMYVVHILHYNAKNSKYLHIGFI